MALAVRIGGVVLGTAFALVGLSVAAAVLPLMIVVGLVTGLLTYNALHDAHERPARDRPGARTARDPRALAALAAGGTVAGTFVAIGMVVLLGVLLAVILAALVLAPVAYRLLRNRRAAAAPPDPAPARPTLPRQPSPTLLPADPAAASVPELCRAWRVSYLVLEHTRDPERLAEIADTRRTYLDELDRRDPHGFRRWLDEGARAASDPARYIGSSPDPAARQDDAAA